MLDNLRLSEPQIYRYNIRMLDRPESCMGNSAPRQDDPLQGQI